MEYRREYVVRLPLPLAQLYSRAFNAKDPRSRHDNAFYLFEATIKLAAAPAVACYVRDVRSGGTRVPELDRLLLQLALPSLGQWVAILRELTRHFGQRPDAASHPLGHLWKQLTDKPRDRPGLLALFRRIKSGVDGKAAGDESCSILDVLDALVQYRNSVFGHGGPRFESFFEKEMGPLLLPAANDLLEEGTFEFLGPRGSRLVYLTDLRTLEDDKVEVGLRELVGPTTERMAPLVVTRAEAENLLPNRVALLWPGQAVPLRLDPLLLYRESETAEEVLFLNRDRNQRQVEFLSYSSGRTERDKATVPEMCRLISTLAGREVGDTDLQRLAEQSIAETPSFEALASTHLVGQRQGDYEILAEIGRGGMGVVYLARQLALGRLVALKMLPADLAGDAVALARFRREIQHLARCEHPNIVKVLVSGTMPDGRLFYTMEYVPGCDLEMVWQELGGEKEAGFSTSGLGQTTWAKAVLSASRKRREKSEQRRTDSNVSANAGEPAVPTLPLPPLPDLPSSGDDPGGYVRRVCALIRDAALALQAVHDQKLTHRDVKPANLMLTPDGARIVLMDFGLVKGESLALTASRNAGFLGTLRYAAPEQMASAKIQVGPAADVRGLGCVLWELLTGKRLFGECQDEASLATSVMTKDVPRLRAIDLAFDRDLEAIVARATERDPRARINSAALLAEYLQFYVDGKPLPIRTPSGQELLVRWCRQNALAASLLAALGLLLTTGAVGGTTLAFVATRNADRADRNAERADRNAERASQNADLATDETRKARLAQSVAEEQRQRSDAALARSDQLLYVNQIETAQREWNSNNAVGAWKHLDSCPSDYRGWEYYYLYTLFNSNQSTWYGHSASVSSVAFSPDGKRIVSGALDNALKVWDVQSGQEILTLKGHRAGVLSVAFSPDGKRIVSGSRDETFKVWNATSGQEILTLKAQTKRVRSVAFSPDGKRIVSGGEDGKLRVWDATSGQETRTLKGHTDHVICVAFSPDGKRIVSGGLGHDKTLKVWDATSGQEMLTLKGHSGSVTSVAFSPDGKRIVSGSWDKTLRVWDAAIGQEMLTLKGQTDRIRSVAFSPDGKRIVSGGEDSTLTVWNAATGQETLTLKGHTAVVVCVAFSPDGKRIVSGSDDNTVKVWDTARGQEPLTLKEGFWPVAFSPDGKRIVSGSLGQSLKLWDASNGQETLTLKGHAVRTPCVAFSPDGKRIVSGGEALKVWDATSGQEMLTLKGQTNRVRSVTFSPDGKRIVSGGEDGKLRVWDATSGQEARTLKGHTNWAECVAFSPDGKRIVSRGGDNTARVWDAANGQEMLTLKGHPGGVQSVAFSRDGKRIVSGGNDGTLSVWDATSGQETLTLRGHTGYVFHVAFSPDGKRIVSGGDDGTLKIWDAANGQETLTLREDTDWVSSVAFSPDGKRIVSTGKHPKVWDASGRPGPMSESELIGLAHSLMTTHRDAEAVRIIAEVARLPAGKNADFSTLEAFFDFRMRYFQEQRDLAGCRETSKMWEALKLRDAGYMYDAACLRARSAAVFRATDKSPLGTEQADADADRAMAWLIRAVAAGYKDTANMKKDGDLDSLRGREDFKKLMAELEQVQR